MGEGGHTECPSKSVTSATNKAVLPNFNPFSVIIILSFSLSIFLVLSFSLSLSRFLSHEHTHAHTGYTQSEQMLSHHLKKILPNLSTISPLSQTCQHNRRDRITSLSLSLKKKKKRRHKKQEGFITFLSFFFSILPFLSIVTYPPPPRHPPRPSTPSSLGGKRERGMGWRRRRRGERHYAYENVLKEV